MKMKAFDMIIIGGGAGAFAAAIRANELKAKTAMINAGLPLGGTCVNVGCVPSKRLLWAGEILYKVRNHNVPGIDLRVNRFDFKSLIQDELNLVSRIRKEKYEKVIRELETVTYFDGYAKFVSGNEVKVNGYKLHAERIIIATGSTAKIPPIDSIEDVECVTHVEALKIQQLPKELIVIGAGPVGIEFAQMFSRFRSKVTVVRRSPGILRFAERDLSECLEQILKREGIKIVTVDEIRKAGKKNGKKVLEVSIDGKITEIVGDEILIAASKIPNTKYLRLDVAGIELDGKNAIIVNKNLQTSLPHIYAAGDVINLPKRFEATAGREGTMAANNALTGSKDSINYSSVPYTVFTDPQLAGVGLTEAEQVKKMGVSNCRTLSFEKIPRAIIMNRTEGWIKMAVDPETRQIQGMHILAPNASELVAEAMVLIINKNTIEDVIDSLPVFPTLSEALKAVTLSFDKDISNLSCCI